MSRAFLSTRSLLWIHDYREFLFTLKSLIMLNLGHCVPGLVVCSRQNEEIKVHVSREQMLRYRLQKPRWPFIFRAKMAEDTRTIVISIMPC